MISEIRRQQKLLQELRLRSGRLPGTILGVFLLVSPDLPALAWENKNAATRNESVVEIIPEPAPVFYEHGNRSDPFLHIVAPETDIARAEEDADEEAARGAQPRGIEGAFIDKTRLEGIVTRSDNRRMAIIRSADNRAYFLREGDRLFDGYLKTIDKDSVVFVRETLMRSGKTLTQEVIRRLREL
jgi:hypothetical protein